jgi:hypothetical protein
MSRHVSRRDRWERFADEYRSGPSVVRYEKGAWWAVVSYEQREEVASPEWRPQQDRLGPYKRPRNAMMAAEERVLLLRRRHPDTVRFEG